MTIFLYTVGGVMAVTGFTLLSKVLDKVYLDARFNVNLAVCGFFGAAGLVWTGGWLILMAAKLIG